MAKNSSSINTDFIIGFFLLEGMIDWFEVVNIKEEPNLSTLNKIALALGVDIRELIVPTPKRPIDYTVSEKE